MLPFILACLSSIGQELDQGDFNYASVGKENPRSAVGGGYRSDINDNGLGSLNESNEVFGLSSNFSQQDMIKSLQPLDFNKESLLSSTKQELNSLLASLNNSEELHSHLESLKSSANVEVNRYLNLFNHTVTDFSGKAVGTSSEVRIASLKI